MNSSSARGVRGARHAAAHGATGLPWKDILLTAVVSVGWALTGMAATAALGLHLLEADSAGSLGPMTAAAVALGAGGSVKPSGDVSAFGLKGAEAHTAIGITPLGVSLVGALLLSWFFLRSLRAAGAVVRPAELLARAGAVVALFTAVLGGLARAGHDVITIDGSELGLDRLPGGSGSGSGGVKIPGLGDVGDIGGLLPDSIGDLVDAKAAVGFTVETAPTLLGGLAWSAGVLLIALLASRRAPLPAGWEAVHRVVRPAVSALVAVVLITVAAGLAAAAYAAAGDDHPKRVAGAALLGAPNGTWLGLPLGLFVPWDGRATGVLTTFLPAPLDELLSTHSDRAVTLGRLAGLDGRVWLLGVAAATTMLLAGVLTAVRTPVGVRSGAAETAVRRPGALGFAARCAVRLGVVTALALPLLVKLTDVSVSASLSVLGFDAFGAGVELHGRPGTALLLGAVWGAGAGAAGALLAWAAGAAGRRAAPLARGDAGGAGGPGHVGDTGAAWDTGAGRPEGAPYPPSHPPHPPHPGPPAPSAPSRSPVQGTEPQRQPRPQPDESGPYTPNAPYRPPNPDTNPYLRLPDGIRQRQRPPAPDEPPPSDQTPAGPAPPADVYGAPTMIGPFPGPLPPRRHPPGDRARSLGDPEDGPPPPPPPPPPAPPPPKPKGRR
jgi:hypothetical protein